MQDGICDAFNSEMRDELLKETLFLRLNHAREVVACWVADYNLARIHSVLDHQTLAAFAGRITAMGVGSTKPMRSAARLLLPPRKRAIVTRRI
ncbi:MAG: transposase [Rubellimicrobium sp.]|nr:transposase [Rubellimicrobium sp.]